MTIKKSFFFFVLSIFSYSSWVSSNNINSSSLRHISTEQGLSQNTVNRFYQDNRGYIWIATSSGLNRFDGDSMLSLNVPNHNINTTPINSLMQDSQNNFWINTYRGLAFVNNDQSINHFSNFPSQPKNQVNANMVVGSEEMTVGNMWVFTWNGAYHYKLAGRDISQPDSMAHFHSPENNILSYEKDGDFFWLGTSKGLYSFNTNDLSLTRVELILDTIEHPAFLNIKINRVKNISSKQLLVSSNKGLFLIEKGNKKNLPAKQIAEGFVSDVTASSDLVYFAIFGEIKTYHLATHKVSTILSLPKILPEHSSYKIKTIFIDKNKLLWIGTQSQGAFIWDTNSLTFESWNAYSNEPNLKLLDNNVWSISQANRGGLWIGTNQGLNHFDTQQNSITAIIDPSTGNLSADNLKIYDLFETPKTLWLATGNGLLNYDKDSKSAKNFLPGFIKPNQRFIIFSIQLVKPQEIWLATNIGVLKFDTLNQTFSYNKHIMSAINAKPARLIKFVNNKLWIGLRDRLITYSFEKKDTQVVIMSAKNAKGIYASLSDLKIIDNRLWVSYARDGIYVIDIENNYKIIKHLHSSNGFPDNMIYSLQKTDDSILASSTQGLIKINPANFDYIVFDHRDGLLSNEFNEGASLQTKDGTLFFGGSKGLIRIEAKQLARNNKTYQPTISSIEILSKNGQSKRFLNLSDNLSIENHKDTTYISFSTLDFISPKEWQYEYWLEGAKQTAPRITKHPEVTLTDLPSGKSIFNLRAVSLEDGRKSKTTQLKITITDSALFTIPNTLSNYVIVALIIILILYRRSMAKRKSVSLYKQLEESEKRMDLALFDDRRGIWDCLIDENDIGKSSFIVYQNKRDPLKLTLEKHFSIMHPDDVEATRSAWIDFTSGKQTSFFETYRSFFYQRWFWNRVYGKVNEFYPSGHPKRATGIWTDINPEKKIEDKLNLYSHAFQSTQDIVFILDNDFNIIVVNNAYEKATGFSCEKMVGRNMVDIVFSRFTEKETEEIKRQVQLNKRWQGESSVPRRNAPSFPVDVRTNVITKNNIDSGYVIVMTDVSQLKLLDKPILETSFHDQLTGLPNKTLAFDRLRELLKYCKKSGRKLSIVFLSIDHFTKLSTRLDKYILDSLIVKLCNRLLPYIQKRDVMACYEQGTYIIILNHPSDDSGILHTINQILKEVSKTFSIDGQSIDISASAGISNYPADGGNWSELITKAETALAQTQTKGDNLFKYYHEDSNKKALEEVSIENRLSQAIHASELFLVFQPTLELHTMKTVELDVNLRWQMQDNRIVYPSQLIPIAEKSGMLKMICNWLIVQSFISLNRWNQEGMEICLNINLSTSYLLEKDSVRFIKEKMALHKINPEFIFIAIHEDDIGSKATSLIDVISELKILGVRLVLDDFGKSIASIQNLQRFEFHAIKFDRILTRNIGKDSLNNGVLRGIISLINEVKLGTVAKGIETTEQLEYLIEHNCQFGQGFLFSDPLIENKMRQYLLDKH